MAVTRADGRSLAGRRLAAYLLDWLAGLVGGWLLVLFAGVILLLASDLDRRDPPAAALYAALIVLSAWLPLWLIASALAWSCWGATPGMLALGIAVVKQDGTAPGVFRAAWRALALLLFSLPLLISPLLLAAAASYGGTGPPVAAAPLALLVILSAAACGTAFVSANGRAWHDRVSGTRIVRVTERRTNSQAERV